MKDIMQDEKTNGGLSTQKAKVAQQQGEKISTKNALTFDIDEQKRNFAKYQYQLSLFKKRNKDIISSYLVNLSTQRLEIAISDGVSDTPKNVVISDEFIESKIKNIVDDEVRERVRKTYCRGSLLQFYNEGKRRIRGEYQRSIQNGQIMWVLESVHMLENPQTHEIMAFICIKDIDKRKKNEIALSEKIVKDELTQLYSKATAINMVILCLGQFEDIHKDRSIMVMDINNLQKLKEQNDSKKYQEIVIEIGQILIDCCGGDAIIGRYSENRFIVFDRKSKDEMNEMCRNILKQMELSFEDIEQNIQVCASIGVATGEIVQVGLVELMANAENALSRAKEKSKNCICFYGEKIYDDNAIASKNLDIYTEEFVSGLKFPIAIIDKKCKLVVYLNYEAERLFGKDTSCFGKEHCYEIVMGRKTPCDECESKTEGRFTENEKIQASRRYAGMFTEKQNILWKGKECYFVAYYGYKGEEIVDYADKMKYVFDLAIGLQSGKNSDAELIKALNYFSTKYNADNTFYLEYDIDDGYIANVTNCDIKECCIAIIEQNISIEMSKSASLEDGIKKGGCPIYFEDIPNGKMSDQLKHICAELNVQSLLIENIVSSNYTTGFLFICNPKDIDGGRKAVVELRKFMGEYLRSRILKRWEYYFKDHDVLTGAYNRNALKEYQRESIHRVFSSMAVIAVDINGLRETNRICGYLYGDKLLKGLHGVLANVFVGASIYRVGSDNFYVVMPDISYSSFEKKTEQLKKLFAEHFSNNIAMGAQWCKDDINIGKIIYECEDLMLMDKYKYFETKKHGVNIDTTQVRESLMKILEKKEVEVYLQPKENITKGEVVGAEALARLNDKNDGLLTPSNFIPELENSKLIHYLDFYIFEKVCQILKSWQDNGLKPLPISLNFSRITLLRDNIVTDMDEMCAKYQVPTNLIEIEITESVGDINQHEIIEICNKIKACGFKISLDDFGSKYSSIDMLTMLKYDAIKLDRSFVNKICYNKTCNFIARAAVGLCKEFGARCIAEGAETKEQIDELLQIGCDYVQGYIVNKPLRVKKFEELYMKNQNAKVGLKI